jgi:hypothetical protein
MYQIYVESKKTPNLLVVGLSSPRSAVYIGSIKLLKVILSKHVAATECSCKPGQIQSKKDFYFHVRVGILSRASKNIELS